MTVAKGRGDEMIKCDNGKIAVKGEGLSVLAELSTLIAFLKQECKIDKPYIEKAVEIGMMTDDELDTDMENMLAEIAELKSKKRRAVK